MSNGPDLVGPLYRADWTRLSLAADVNTWRELDLGRFEDGGAGSQPPHGLRSGPRLGEERARLGDGRTRLGDGEAGGRPDRAHSEHADQELVVSSVRAGDTGGSRGGDAAGRAGSPGRFAGQQDARSVKKDL